MDGVDSTTPIYTIVTHIFPLEMFAFKPLGVSDILALWPPKALEEKSKLSKQRFSDAFKQTCDCIPFFQRICRNVWLNNAVSKADARRGLEAVYGQVPYLGCLLADNNNMAQRPCCEQGNVSIDGNTNDLTI